MPCRSVIRGMTYVLANYGACTGVILAIQEVIVHVQEQLNQVKIM